MYIINIIIIEVSKPVVYFLLHNTNYYEYDTILQAHCRWHAT